jgi:hypothetical protein
MVLSENKQHSTYSVQSGLYAEQMIGTVYQAVLVVHMAPATGILSSLMPVRYFFEFTRER